MALRRPERYATLLRIRQREEDARAAALRRALDAVQRALQDRSELQTRHAETLTQAARIRTGAEVRMMDQYAHYERHLTRLVAEKDSELERLRAEQSGLQADFEESHRRRKMADRLIERASERWDSHVETQDRRAAEEVVAMRYGRRGARARKEL